MHRATAILVRKELRELGRDRRAVGLTLLLPVLLYPLVLGGMHQLEQRSEGERQRRELAVGLAGEGPLEAVAGPGRELAVRPLPDHPDSLRAAVRDGRVEAAVRVPPRWPAPAASAPETLQLFLHGARGDSREAARRLAAAADSLVGAERARRLEQLAPGAPGGPLLRRIDVATASEAGGAAVAPLLLYLLLMNLFVGGAALAGDLLAGEKERGTLETLFLAPVPREAIARGKLVVATAGTATTGLLSLASLALCFHLGWMQGGKVTLSPAALALAALLVLPLAALVGAVLLGISAWARSLRESQQFTLPALLLLFVPAVLAASQAIELNPLLSLVPVANVAFALRDLLGGRLAWGWLLPVVGSGVLWAWLAARWVGGQLRREEAVLAFDPEPLLAHSPSGRRRAAHLALALAVLAYFYGGSWLQARYEVAGLVLSLWGLLPLLALAGWWLARPRDARAAATLGLRRPPWPALVAAPLLAWGSILPLLGGIMELQQRWLPAPTAGTEALEALLGGLPPWQLLLLGALSPAICEELLFRGVGQGLLQRRGSHRGAVVASALYFGLAHLSVFRFVPTFLLGLLLGWARARSGSLATSVVLHFVYNGSLLLGGLALQRGAEWPFDPRGPLAWLLSLAALAGGLALLRHCPSPGGDPGTR